jgi:hypothetical protein
LIKENNYNLEKNGLLQQQLIDQNAHFSKILAEYDKKLVSALEKIPQVNYI